MAEDRIVSVRRRITSDLTAAMKSRDALRLGVVRMLKARMMEAEVEQRAQRGPGYELQDEEAIAVIGSYAKQRRDSIEAYRQAGREDLVAKEQAELAIIHEYLPAQLSEEDLRRIVAEAIAQSGASSIRDMGAVMKLVMAKVKGTADGKMVNQLVREGLAGPDPRLHAR